MNRYIEKNISKIILLFLIGQPIIDVLTACSIHFFKLDFTIGMIIRTLFLLFCLYYIFFLTKDDNKNKYILYFGLLFIYSVLFLTNIYFTEGVNLILVNVSNLLKVMSIPILLIFFYLLYKDKKIDIKNNVLGNIYLVYLFFLFVPSILGIGFDTYEITKEGSIGFFNSANEVGGIISILMPFFLLNIKNMENKFLKVFLFLIFLFVIVSIGTKGPLLSLFIIVIYYLIKLIKDLFIKKEYKKLSGLGVIVLVGAFAFILLLPQTTFYKNIETHLDFLEVTSIDDIVTSPKVIDHFIFSERLSFWSKTNKIYKTKSLSTKLLGLGYIVEKQIFKTIEMDYVDIFYHQGIIGFILVLTSFMMSIFIIIRDLIKLKKPVKNKDVYVLSILLSVLLAFFTGHVLLSMNVFIFVALIINMFYNEIRVVQNEKR